MPQPPEPQGSCPRCGAVTQPLQQFCLECGERLPSEPSVFSRLARSERWLWPALLFLAVTAVATAASVAAAPSGTNGTGTVVATESVTVGPGTRTAATTPTTSTVKTTPPPTLTTGTLPSAPGDTNPPTTTAPAVTVTLPPSGALVSWPHGKSGYTDVLESLPASGSRDAALARARAADRAGLPQPGVLLSSDFSSLHRGYFVVFSGIYTSSDQATSALAGAHAHGFPDAYAARVSP